MIGTLFLIILYHIDLSYITEQGIVPAASETVMNAIIPPENSSAPEITPSQIYDTDAQNQEPMVVAEATIAPAEQTDRPKASPHEGFVYLSDALPEAKFDVRYATTHNFTGQVVDGYLSENITISIKAAEALQKASTVLKSKGYGVLIYDAYRPKCAVSCFIEWGEQPENNLTKEEFYPDYDKKELFKLGYLAKRSAIDLTLFSLETGELLDMGSPYDFLGPISNHGTDLITKAQTENRNILKDSMKLSGFKELRTEWWHYQLIDEPFPETFFDFVIE